MQCAELLDSRTHRVGGIGARGDITLNPNGALSQFSSGVLLLPRYVNEDHRRALLVEPAGGLFAHSGTGAGNQSDFSVETLWPVVRHVASSSVIGGIACSDPQNRRVASACWEGRCMALRLLGGT